MSDAPHDEALAVSFQGDDPPAELDKVLPDEKHAGVSLQRHGGDVQQAVALPLQQLVELLFQEDLTGDHLFWCSFLTHRGLVVWSLGPDWSHLADPQLVRAALDRSELVKHGDAVLSVGRWRIFHAEQGFIPEWP